MYTNEERGSFLNKILLKTCVAKKNSKTILENLILENKKKFSELARKCIEDFKNEISKAAESGKETCIFYPLVKYPESSDFINDDFYACVREYFLNEGFEIKVDNFCKGITVNWSLNK